MHKKSSKTLALFLTFAMVFAIAMGLVTKTQEDAVYAALRANSQYSLAGAEYQLYTDQSCTTKAKDANGNNAIMTTNADGEVSPLEIEVGTYYAKEVKASPGYLLDSTVQTLNVTNGGTVNFTSTEAPTIGRLLRLQKYDSSGENGWRKLLGAEYTLRYYDVDPSTEDVSGMTPVRQWKFKTVQKENSEGRPVAGIDFMSDDPLEGSDEFYEAKVQAYDSNGNVIRPDNEEFDARFHHYKLDDDGTMTRVMPIGVFTIEETKAPQGLSRNTTVYYGSVSQASAGADAVTTVRGTDDFTVNVHTGKAENDEEPQAVEIAIEKIVGQTGDSEPIGKATSLEGAEYNVYFDTAEAAEPELVGKITTDSSGKGKLTERTMGDQAFLGQKLRPGTYLIEETKAPAGFVIDKYYLKDDGTTGEVSGDIEVICDYEQDGTPVKKKISGTYENGQHKFLARVQVTDASVFTFTAKSVEFETETHIKKTDAATSKEVPGATLQIFSLAAGASAEPIEEWVSTNEEHIVYGLKSGRYLLREITAPNGYDVAEDIEFTVKNDEIVNKVEMKNKPLEVGTTATDADTNSHQGTFKTNEVINDKVVLKGLNKDWTYQLKGVVMDKATGEPMKDAEGKDITAQSEEFKATGDEMEVELKFSVDSSKFSTDKVAVVFEKLYRTKPVPVPEGHPERPEEDLPKEIAKHENLNDPAQTINYGGIVATVATDAKSKGHNILGEKGAVIVDTVKYENVSTEETYTAKGELFDKTTGKLTGIKAEAKFKPEKSSGSVQLEFKFDASQFLGHKLVAFETLLINDVEVNKHEDPNDKDQTVNVPEAKTVAVNPENNDHLLNDGEKVTIKDTITYKNLTPNKPYTAKGTLQYRDGLFNRLNPVMKDGKPLTAEASFTPTEESGTVEVTFVFDATDLEGKTVVVFEDIYDGEYIVASHADPDDADQSVHIPKIRTKVGKKDGEYVIDVVKYENLIVGKPYKVKGYFVGKSNGERISGSDGEITFTPDSPNGKIEVRLKPVKKGASLVAFEEVYVITNDPDSPGASKETLIGEHKDINDPDQTLTEKGTPQTGDATTIYLVGAAFLLTAALAGVLIKRRKLTTDK